MAVLMACLNFRQPKTKLGIPPQKWRDPIRSISFNTKLGLSLACLALSGTLVECQTQTGGSISLGFWKLWGANELIMQDSIPSGEVLNVYVHQHMYLYLLDDIHTTVCLHTYLYDYVYIYIYIHFSLSLCEPTKPNMQTYEYVCIDNYVYT